MYHLLRNRLKHVEWVSANFNVPPPHPVSHVLPLHCEGICHAPGSNRRCAGKPEAHTCFTFPPLFAEPFGFAVGMSSSPSPLDASTPRGLFVPPTPTAATPTADQARAETSTAIIATCPRCALIAQRSGGEKGPHKQCCLFFLRFISLPSSFFFTHLIGLVSPHTYSPFCHFLSFSPYSSLFPSFLLCIKLK